MPETQTQLLAVTDAALKLIVEHLEMDGRPNLAARLAVLGKSSAGFQYSFNFIEPTEKKPDDVTVDLGRLVLHVDAKSAESLKGAKVDYVTNEWGGGGFQVDNPNPIWSDETSLKIQELLDSQINPAIASHGGFCELLEVKGPEVYIRLGGGCQGCGQVDVTLKQGIEVMIKENFPQITKVIDSTDHAAGANPYYSPSKGGGDSPSKGGCGHEH